MATAAAAKNFSLGMSIGGKKPKPARRKAVRGKTLIAVDIGSKTTRVLLGSCGSSSITVDKYDSCVNPEDVSNNGKINNVFGAETNLKKLLGGNGVKLKNAITTIESTEIIKRELIIPQVSEGDELGLVTFEMGQYLAIDVSNFIIQYKRVGTIDVEGQKKTRVLVGAVPKSVIEPYINLFESNGLNPFSMDVKTNSVEKLINFDAQNNPQSPFKGKNLVFVDMGHSYFGISLYKDGRYQFSRMIEMGGSMIDDLISSQMDVDLLEAERIKIDLSNKISILDLARKFGKMDTDTARLSANQRILLEILRIIDKWLAEISNVIKYHTSRNRGNTIDGVYLYGGCSLFRDADKYFEARLGIKTRALTELGSVSVKDKSASAGEFANYVNLLGALIIN
ncbi:MAG: pilus assembly protein PilM [Clostridiales bacterium]|jgi:type IV pilus assembly protein PilM|nr:pilus assembly protein PilM [Clostridiales bacterium]